MYFFSLRAFSYFFRSDLPLNDELAARATYLRAAVAWTDDDMRGRPSQEVGAALRRE